MTGEQKEAAVQQWAERYGAVGGFARSFARWYVGTGRTDDYAAAYDVFLVRNGHKTVAETEAEIRAVTAQRDALRGASLHDAARSLPRTETSR